MTPEWGHATTQKLWPKANARWERNPRMGLRDDASVFTGFASWDFDFRRLLFAPANMGGAAL